MKSTNLGNELRRNLTLLMVAVILIITVVVSWLSYEEMQASIVRETGKMLDLVETQMANSINNKFDDLHAVAQLVEEDRFEEVYSFYKALGENVPFDRVDIVTEDGRIIGQIPQDDSRVGYDYSGNPTYRSLRGSGLEVSLTGMAYDDDIGKNVCSIGLATSKGYVFGHFGTENINQMIRGVDIQGGYLAVTDYQGRYVAHTDITMVSDRHQDPYVKQILDSKLSNQSIAMIEGQGYIVSYRLDELQKLVLIYYQDILVYRRLILLIMAIVVGMLLVFIPISLTIVGRISGRVKSSVDELVEASRGIASGDYDQKAEVLGYGEFQELYDNFMHMGRQVQRREKAIGALNEEIESNYYKMVMLMANAIEAKDLYTGNHCVRVRDMAMGIGEALGLSESDLRELKYGSTLHDIGKIGIPETILNKTGALDDDEYNKIKRHSSIGYDIIRELPGMEKAKGIILHHHESYDGTGYPSGLAGEEIPLLARIVTVADAFDAMTSQRSYRKNTRTTMEAIDELKRCTGSQFDARLVEVFEQSIIDNKLKGL